MPSLPPSSVLLDLLLRVLLPALQTSALVLILFVLPGKKWCTALGAALALAAGVAYGNYFREALPWLPEQRPAWHWLPTAALAALAIGLLAQIPHVPLVVGWLLRASAAGLATWLLVLAEWLRLPAEQRTETWWLAPAFFAVVLANWAVLELSAHRAPGGVVAGGLAFVLLGGAAVLVHAHSARLADGAFLPAAGLFGIAAVAWWTKADIAAAMPAGAVLLPGLLLAGQAETFSEVPLHSFMLVALAPLALAPTLLLPVAWLEGWRWRLVQLGLLLAPVIVAVTLAMRAEPLEFEDPHESPVSAERLDAAQTSEVLETSEV